MYIGSRSSSRALIRNQILGNKQFKFRFLILKETPEDAESKSMATSALVFKYLRQHFALLNLKGISKAV